MNKEFKNELTLFKKQVFKTFEKSFDNFLDKHEDIIRDSKEAHEELVDVLLLFVKHFESLFVVTRDVFEEEKKEEKLLH